MAVVRVCWVSCARWLASVAGASISADECDRQAPDSDKKVSTCRTVARTPGTAATTASRRERNRIDRAPHD